MDEKALIDKWYYSKKALFDLKIQLYQFVNKSLEIKIVVEKTRPGTVHHQCGEAGGADNMQIQLRFPSEEIQQ